MARRRPRRRRRRWNIKKTVITRFFSIAKFMLPAVVSCGVVVVLFWASYAFAIQSELFILKKVTIENSRVIEGAEAFRFLNLEPRQSMLSLNLKSIERRVRSRYPEFKHVRVHRVLPDELRVVLTKRAAIAQIENDRYYLIDSDGMIVSGGLRYQNAQVPVIRGIHVEVKDMVLGRRLGKTVVGKPLKLIRELMRLKGLGTHKITLLDVTDKRNTTLWIDDKIEVRLSDRNLSREVDKLADTVKNMELDSKKIRYIDLRFDDVVIGPR